MSLQNLHEENNEVLYCKTMYCDTIVPNVVEIGTLEIDNIVVDNATVLTQVTTPHINSNTTTFNTVGAINVNTVNGAVINLESTNINANTITATNGTIQNLNSATLFVSSDFNSPLGIIQTFGSTNANITSLTAGSITTSSPLLAPEVTTPLVETNIISTLNTGNVTFTHPIIGTNISCSNLVSTNGSIDNINGSNIGYSTGSVSEISGSNITYDQGYIDALQCKELAIYTALTECPTATINNISVSNMTSVNDSIVFDKPLSLPNVGTNESHLSYYEYATGSVNTSGCIVTPLNYRAVRVGNMVTISIQGTPASLIASSSSTINVSLPSQFAPFSTDVYGLCITMNAASLTNLGRYQFSSSGTLTIYQSLSAANFVSGDRAGFGSQLTYLTLSFTRAP